MDYKFYKKYNSIKNKTQHHTNRTGLTYKQLLRALNSKGCQEYDKFNILFKIFILYRFCIELN